MLNSLKRALKEMLIERQHKLYNEELTARKLTYDRWIKEQEEGLEIADIIFCEEEKCLKSEAKFIENGGAKNGNEGELAKKDSLKYLAVENASGHSKGEKKKILWLKDNFSEDFIEAVLGEMKTTDENGLVFISFYDGCPSRRALPLILKSFEENKNLIMIYGDEDVVSGEERVCPWFKPDWSPDTFLSYFYFGGLVAVRQSKLKEAYEKLPVEEKNCICDGKELIYKLLYEVLKAGGAFKIGHGGEDLPVAHVPYVLFHSRENGYEQIKELQLPVRDFGLISEETGKKQAETTDEKTKLSIIIPSKDNPDVLFQCVDSLVTRTRTNCSYEILIIDNGSNEKNKETIEEKVHSLQERVQGMKEYSGFAGIRYIYHPMNFNFSAMCNMELMRQKETYCSF